MDTVEKVTEKSLGFDDTISLDFDARFKRKIKLVSDNGYEFFLSLDKASEDNERNYYKLKDNIYANIQYNWWGSIFNNSLKTDFNYNRILFIFSVTL